MDLAPYTCRGFPGEFDRLMAEVPVAGIDLLQARSMIRLCDKTEALLYAPGYSPVCVRPRPVARPGLKAIAGALGGSIDRAMAWTRDHVRHPNFAGVALAPDRALSEEQLIESGLGWCNEQCRVFIALCEMMSIGARLCFLFHANGRTAHTATEVRIGARWAMVDVTFGVRLALPDGTPAEARDLRGGFRRLAHEAYRAPLDAYYAGTSPPIDVERGGDLFESIGICNYLIDGVERCDG